MVKPTELAIGVFFLYLAKPLVSEVFPPTQESLSKITRVFREAQTLLPSHFPKQRFDPTFF